MEGTNAATLSTKFPKIKYKNQSEKPSINVCILRAREKKNPLTITTLTCLSTVQSIQAHDTHTHKDRKTLKPHLNAYAAVIRRHNTYKVHGRQSTTNKQENKQYKYALKQKWHNKKPRFRDTRKSKQKTENKKQKRHGSTQNPCSTRARST